MSKRRVDGSAAGEDEPPERVPRSGNIFWDLQSIAEHITDEHFKEIKYLCRAKIPTRTLEKLQNPNELFHQLYDSGLIDDEDKSFLEQLLEKVGLKRWSSTLTTKGNNSSGMSKLQECLKTVYKGHFTHIQPIPWNDDLKLKLREIYTSLSVKEVKKGGLHAGEEIKNLHDMFKLSYDKEHALRIRIEGPPALGKSTLCKRLAYDWACGELPRYKLLFFLEMRHVTEESMTDEIFWQLLPRDIGIKKEELESLISENVKSVLFLFDGLDEIDESFLKRTELPDHIQGKVRQHCTTVITARPHLRAEYLHKCDMHLAVEGFTEKCTNEYINKYFQDDPLKGKYLITEIQKLREGANKILMTDILKSPLHVSFLCILWEDYKEEQAVDFPKTLTGLYTEILVCILKRYCVKNDITLDGDVIPEDVTEARDKLAFDAYRVYIDSRSVFQENDISSPKSLALGLLVHDLGHSRIKKTKMYYFYHKTWQDYFTALHISRHMNKENRDILCTFLDEPSKSQSVLKFLTGISDLSTSLLIFEEFDRKIKTMREERLSDQLLDLNGVCFECLHISRHGAKCVAKIESLHRSLIYFCDDPQLAPMPKMCLYEPQCDYEGCVEVSKKTCRFIRLLNMFKLKPGSIQNFRLHFPDVTDLSVLAEVCKEREMSLESLVVFCKISDSQEPMVDRLSDMIKCNPGLNKLQSFRVYAHVDCRKVNTERFNDGLKKMFSRVAERENILHFVFGVELPSNDIGMLNFEECFDKFIDKGPRKVSFLVKKDNSRCLADLQASLSKFIQRSKKTESIEVAYLTPGHDNSYGLDLTSTSPVVNCLSLFDENLSPESKSLNTLINSKETPIEISIGKFSNKTIYKACEMIRHNRTVRNLRLFVEAPVDHESYNVMIDSLRGNPLLKHFAITYIGMILYSDKLVDCLLAPLKQDVESNKCSLESITFTWEDKSKSTRQGILNFLSAKASFSENCKYNVIKHYGYSKYQHILRYTSPTNL